MTVLSRVRVSLTGSGLVGAAVSTFYSSSPTSGSLAANIAAFYTTCIPAFPDNVTFAIPHDGDLIEDSDGSLQGTWSESGSTSFVTGSVTGLFAQGVGARVRWSTAGIHNGRRVVGTTFMVPLANGGQTTDGLWSTGTASLIDGAADTLRAAEDLFIWSRPAPGSSDGESSLVTGSFVPLQISTLRSRRV